MLLLSLAAMQYCGPLRFARLFQAIARGKARQLPVLPEPAMAKDAANAA
jgi:hypothetical protein